MTTAINYSSERTLNVDQFIDILKRSSLSERRPVDDRACIEGMLKHANLMVTAWDGETLVGVARCVTDFHYACYLSDLAVDQTYQRQGIGRALQTHCQNALGPRCTMILLSAPKAVDYYPHIGYRQHHSCWLIDRDATLH